MPHVRPSRLRRQVLPALLLSAVAASGVGLWAMDDAELETPALASTAAHVALDRPSARTAELDEDAPPAAQPVQDMRAVVDRASRSRRVEVAVVEKRRTALVARAVRARALAAAKARAEAERLRRATVCPAPTASFIDSWGFGRSGGRAHQGTDMMASFGDPVYAVRSGTVTTDSGGNGGITLSLTDEQGDVYYYAHNAENLVSSGDRVTAGDLIARVGSSGNASAGAPHLHFEVQPGGGAAIPSYVFLREIC